MTPDQNKLIHAYVTDGKGEWRDIADSSCFYCGCTFPTNPSYSAPDNFRVLTEKLFGDEMWDRFFWDVRNRHTPTVGSAEHTLYLFSDYSRFCSLFAKFLCLDSTIEEFGYMECEYHYDCSVKGKDQCPYDYECKGFGKRKKPWAKLAGRINNGL